MDADTGSDAAGVRLLGTDDHEIVSFPVAAAELHGIGQSSHTGQLASHLGPASGASDTEAETKRWQRTRSHPLYPQLVQAIAENSIEGLPPHVAAQRMPRVMAPALPDQFNSKEMTESVDFFVKDKIHNIARNTEAQRKARTGLETVGKQLIASLEQPVEHRLQTLSGGGGAAGDMSAGPKRSQEEMKQLFMVASAKIQQERKKRGTKKKPRKA